MRMTTNITIPRWLANRTNTSQELVVHEVIQNTPKSVVVRASIYHDGGANACYRCGRELTHPVSRLVGFGPDCCATIGLPRPPLENAEAWLEEAKRLLETPREIRLPKSQITGNLPISTVVEPVAPTRNAVAENGRVVVSFDYNAHLVNDVKALPDRRYDRDRKVWSVAPCAELKSFLDANNFQYGDDVVALFNTDMTPAPERVLSLDGDNFVFTFRFNIAIKNAVKPIWGGRGFNPNSKVWEGKGNRQNASQILAVAQSFDFEITDEAAVRLATLMDRGEDLTSLSSATETDFVANVEGLRDFQHVAVEYAGKAKRFILADQMGTGKTLEILATAEHYDLYPMVAIVPASLKLNWEKEVKQWLPHRSVEVLNGRTGRYDSDITIINYDILSDGWVGNTPDEIKASKKNGAFIPTAHTIALSQMGLRLVAMDEGHKIKEKDAQRSRAVYYLNEGEPSGRAANFIAEGTEVEYRIWATGTPIPSRPKELIFPLQTLGVFEDLFGGFFPYVNRYCQATKTPWGLDINGSDNETELNAILRANCYIRRLTEDVVDQMPELNQVTQWVRLDNREEYDFAYSELIDYVGERAKINPELLEEIAAMDEDEQHMALQRAELDAEARAEMAEALVRLTTLRRITAEGKLNNSLNWIADFLENGESLIVFANHRKVVNAIAERFNAPKIMGGMNVKVVERGKEAFQAGDEQLIVLNIKAGGVGHTLTAAHHVAFVEYPWTPDEVDQAIYRAYARQNDMHGVTVWNLIAEDSIEEHMITMLEEKRQVVNAVVDGKEKVAVRGLIDRILGRG
jgi:hypothetical protein